MTVRQFHFTAWPDHGVPTYPTSLLAFHKKFRSFDDTQSGPAIIHCSAGVGRTGTFIALDSLLEQAKDKGVVDVLGCVRNMRTQRVNMVQTQVISHFDVLFTFKIVTLNCAMGTSRHSSHRYQISHVIGSHSFTYHQTEATFAP